MDGSYNYGFRAPHTNSPLSPDTPASASYKTNVKRTKTKKWVEAKTQNYDGDDWGNDFDDELEEPAPVAPLKPTGFRQPGQSTTAALPSHQLPTSQPAEPVPLMRPPQPTANESGLSSSPRATAGLPPLQIQTPSQPTPEVVQLGLSDFKPPIASGPSSIDSTSEKGPYEHLVSPQSASIGPVPGAAPTPFAGRQEHPQGTSSPVGARRASPAPAQPQAALFPPRKSSMGQHDRDGQSSNSRSSSTQRPWVEQRSASPSNGKPSGPPPNSKALPFIRPSDIYRRMDDDKDKETGSTEAGMPSVDSVGSPRTDRSVSPAPVPVIEAGEQGRRGSAGNPEVQEAAVDNSRPALSPVAERKNEYGLDRLAAQPQNHGQASPSGSAQEINLAVPEPQLQRPTAEEADQQRRYSTSPRLPDVARMSLFGDDFFSNPSKFAEDAPPLPSLPSVKPKLEGPTVAENSSSVGERAAATETPAGVTSPPSTASSTPQPTSSSPALEQPDRQGSRSPSQISLAQESTEMSKSGLPSQSSRPSLPGGWVTETRSISDEQTPPAVAEEKAMVSLDSGEVSPISDNEDEKFQGRGIATVRDRESIPVSIPEISEQAAQDQGRAHAELKIVSPLNHQATDSSPSVFVPPEKLQRESTMSTVTDPSPVKESDMLREEIMRSLSPVRPTSDLNDPSNSRTLSPAEDTGTRESTYLHGVYDDYWAAGDDRPDVPNLPSKQPGQLEQESTSAVNETFSNVPPLSPRKETMDQPPALGRRFSWETGSEQVTPKPSDTQKDPLSQPQPQPLSAAEAALSSGRDDQQPPSAQAKMAGEDGRSPPQTTVLDDAHISVQQDAGAMSHQVSQVSSGPRDRVRSEVMEPPSPVSVTTDKNNISAAPTRRLSLAEEKSMARVSSNPVSPSPPPGDHPALAQASEATPPPASPASSQQQQQQQQQPAQPVKIQTFKEIMDLPNPSDRINKYNETRAQFASMDSGLNNWLVTLRSQHPEHANVTASFGTDAPGPGQSQTSPTTSQPASQQPYYQQYLNASSPNVSTAASGRPPVGGASMGSSHSPSSDFKHSSGQVGAKGKGLLLAAGKAGKGLLSKGKSKLRGTGDKSDSSPPPAQSKVKAERRTSWGISLGTRSSPRADSHAHGHGHVHSRSHSGSVSGPTPQTIPEHPASPTPPPQLPQTSRISPFDTLTRDNQASAWAPPRPQTPKHPDGSQRDSDSEPVSPVSDTQYTSAPKGNENNKEGNPRPDGDLQVPRPISKVQPSWDPLTSTPLVEEGLEMGLPKDPSSHAPPSAHHAPDAPQAVQADAAAGAKNTTADDQYDDWVVVSPQSPPSGQIQVVSPQSPQPARPFQYNESGREVFEDGDEAKPAFNQAVSNTQQAHQQAHPQTLQQLPSQQHTESPQRHSSFIGLPPIRRSSTFGVNLTRRAKKRFSLDEDDNDNGNVYVASPIGTTADQHVHDSAGPARFSQGDPSLPSQSVQPAMIETGSSASRKDSAMSHGVLSVTSTQAATFATESTGVSWRVGDEKRPLDSGSSHRPAAHAPAPIDTRTIPQNEGRPNNQPYGPGMRPQQGMMSPTFGGNPIHHLPPQGPWKLEESHLSEPLAASRNRHSGGSLSPQQQAFFGYDKETGVPPQAVPRSETQMPPRQKFSEVPPSSAHRYPGLFSPPQTHQNPEPPAGSRSSHDLGQQFYNRDSASLYRTQTGDSEVSSFEPSADEDRGRSRRSSGFFKEIGGRFSRNSSRERPVTKPEDRGPGATAGSDVRGDEVSEFSVTTGDVQDRQRRRSSFFLNLRGSKPSDVAMPQSHDGEGVTPSPRASLNTGVSPQIQQPAGFADGKRSFLGAAANESSAVQPTLSRSSTSTAGNEAASGAMGPPKNRFSGFTGKMFNRASSQQDLQVPQKPGTSHSTTSIQSRSPGTPGNQPGMPSPLAALGRERSNTTGSGPYQVQQANKQLQNVEEEERGRRSSAGGFFSGLFSKRPSSKTPEVQQPAQLGHYQNGQFSGQLRAQPPGHQMPPSSLGPGRQMGQPPVRSPPQHFEQQQQLSSLSQGFQMHSGADIKLQPQPQAPSLHQRLSDGSLLPSPQLSQRLASAPETQSHVPSETGVRSVIGMENDESRAPPIALDPEAHNARLPQSEPRQPFNGPPQLVKDPDVSASQAFGVQPPPEISHLDEQRQPFPSVLQAREQLPHPRSQVEQTRQAMHMPGSGEPTQQLSVRRPDGCEETPISQTPPLAHPQDSASRALGIQEPDPARRPPDQPTLLSAHPGIRAASPNGVVSQSEISQRSSVSTSPKPPVASTTQPSVAPPLLDRQMPSPGSHQRSPGPVVAGNMQQLDRMGRPIPGFHPQGQQQFPVTGNRNPAQFSQMPPPASQRSSMPYAPVQTPQSTGQGPGDQGQSSVSKWFKNRTSTQPAQLQSYQGHAKESTAKSILNAFKRSSKQPEPRPPQQVPQPSQGQQHQAQPYQMGQEQQRIPPPGPLPQPSPQPTQGPHLMYQEQRQSPSSMASFGQRPPPQGGQSRGSPEYAQRQGQLSGGYRGPPVDPVMTRAIPAGAGLNTGTSQAQRVTEPRYDQVPIPRGYAAVHGEGGIAPSPYDIARTSPPVQYPPYHMPQTQQIGHSVAQRHPSDVSMYSQSGPSVPQGHHLAHGHMQPVVVPEGDRRISTASHQSNVSHTSHGTQPGASGPNGGLPLFSQQHQQQNSRGVRLVGNDNGQNVTPNTQFGQQPPPQPQPHQQRYSPVNMAAPHGAPPQVQPVQAGDPQGPHVAGPPLAHVHNSDMVRGISDTPSSLHPQAHTQTYTQTHGLMVDEGSIAGSNSRSVSPGTQIAAERNLTPEPPAPEPTGSHLSVNVQRANQETPDDIYESTPRLPSGPVPPPAKPITATRTGQSMVSDSSADEAPRNATHANGNANSTGSAALTRGKSTRAELEDTEDERKRTIRLEAQEEKILVDPYEELQSGGLKYRKEEDPEMPQMSATSYPGQEWNPYGAGGYEDWD